MYTFVELEPFARARADLLDDDSYCRLQQYLIAEPEAGDVIPGSGGCRKVRWTLRGRGKRGGARVIYFLRLSEDEIVLVTMYSKGDREDVDRVLLARLRRAYEEGRKRK